MRLNGKPYHPAHPATAVKRGVVSVPQDRRAEGCILGMATTENLTMGSLNTFFKGGLLRLKSESRSAQGLAETYQVKTGDIRSPISTLSGGNQQKVVIARAASRATEVLLLDEPTQGVDALAKQEIWSIIRGFAATGKAVVVASTDFDEFVGLCDRVIVLDRGAIAASAAAPTKLPKNSLHSCVPERTDDVPHPGTLYEREPHSHGFHHHQGPARSGHGTYQAGPRRFSHTLRRYRLPGPPGHRFCVPAAPDLSDLGEPHGHRRRPVHPDHSGPGRHPSPGGGGI